MMKRQEIRLLFFARLATNAFVVENVASDKTFSLVNVGLKHVI